MFQAMQTRFFEWQALCQSAIDSIIPKWWTSSNLLESSNLPKNRSRNEEAHQQEARTKQMSDLSIDLKWFQRCHQYPSQSRGHQSSPDCIPAYASSPRSIERMHTKSLRMLASTCQHTTLAIDPSGLSSLSMATLWLC